MAREGAVSRRARAIEALTGKCGEAWVCGSSGGRRSEQRRSVCGGSAGEAGETGGGASSRTETQEAMAGGLARPVSCVVDSNSDAGRSKHVPWLTLVPDGGSDSCVFVVVVVVVVVGGGGGRGVASDDGGFYGITTYSKKASPGHLAAERFELHSANGVKLWKIENPEVSEFFISPGGRLVVGMSGGEGSGESPLAFYDHDGELISSTVVSLPQGILFSSNGKHVLVNSAKDGLLLFDDSGELKVKLAPCDWFAISSGGERPPQGR